MVDALHLAIANITTPSEAASYSRLLALAGRLTDDVRASVTDLARRSFSGDLAGEIVLDVVAGRRRPLAYALVDSLGGASNLGLGRGAF